MNRSIFTDGFNPARRRFLRNTGIAGGGLLVGVSLSGCSSPVLPFEPKAGAFIPNALLQITPDNLVRFYCPREEMGQGITTGLATLVAEELDVAPEALDISLPGVHPDYANPAMGVQATGGSTSLSAHYYPLRQTAADVRAALIQAAAMDLGVAAADLSTDNGHVVASGKRYPYGRFVATAQTLALPENTPLKPAASFQYIGRDFPRLDAVEKSTGTAEFAIDVEVPGMQHAVVKRPPVAGAGVVRFEAATARAMPGVRDVFEISTGVAVVADSYWQAKRAAAILDVEWTQPALARVNSADQQAEFDTAMRAEAGQSTAEQGDFNKALADAGRTFEAQYWAPYLAHAPMEPMSAVLHIRNGEADLWSGTQSPQGAQGMVARYAGLDKDRVRVHTPYLGGAFGRRGTLSHIGEIAEIAAVTGKPVHLLWSREDDIQSGLFRPSSLMRIRAGVDESGLVTAWEAKRVGGNISPDTVAAMLPAMLPTMVPQGVMNWTADMADTAFARWMVDHSSIEGLYEDYDFPNRQVLHVTRDDGLPLTFWRSVGHSYTAFAKESAMDELAAQAGQDPVEFRLNNCRNNPRLHNVIRVAGERMQAMQTVPGRGLGMAAHSSFNSSVAEVAEVSIVNGQIRVHHVLCVVDCGLAVNPDVIRAQMEGGIMYGLTAALHGEVLLENGAVKQSNFHDYPILRMNEAPSVEVVIIDSDGDPTGVGEPGLPPIAPAVANAIAALTGQRLRSLPLRLA